MKISSAKVWAWLFLYGITVVCVGVYGFSIYDLHKSLSKNVEEISVISLRFLLILPIALPCFHLAWLLTQKTSRNEQTQNRNSLIISVILFTLCLITAVAIDTRLLRMLESSGYTECQSKEIRGLRSTQHTYLRNSNLCK